MAFSLRSRAFAFGHRIPARFTEEGASISPPLQWSGAPSQTVELALLVEDPDAPTPRPFVHWLIYGISPNISQLPEGLPRQEEIQFPILARQGLNSILRHGYLGPNPPFWHGAHRYYFRLFALDAPIILPPGAGRTDFDRAIEGHVIAEAKTMGIYSKPIHAQVRRALPWALTALGAASMVGIWRWKARDVTVDRP